MHKALVIAGLAAASTLHAGARTREIGFDQAKQIALMVASHDHIQVDDRDVVIDSMDTRNAAGFIPGYFSFTIIRESNTPTQPDETLRMYIVSKRTADTWEMNLCTHYSFPELTRMQHSIMQQTGNTPEDDHDVAKMIGCTTVQAEASQTQR